jgi:biotin operon repressor
LLQNLDRQASNQILVTQDYLANMLGVRRESITEAARKLQQKGLISYSRGRLNVLNRQALEAEVCECYHVIRGEFDRLIPAFAEFADAPSIALAPDISSKYAKQPPAKPISSKPIH